MRKILFIFFLFSSSITYASNINIAFDVDIQMNCKFEKIIINNSEYNYETLLPDQIKRKDLKKLRFTSKKPDILKVKNLSKFITKTDLELKIVNKDIILIRAFDDNTKYSESAVFTILAECGGLIDKLKESAIVDTTFDANGGHTLDIALAS